MMNEIHVILLAAGLSSRMGQLKPLLPWRGMTLLEHACRTYAHMAGEKIVVLNKAVAAAGDMVSSYGFQSVINEHPDEGQSGSLRLGLAELDRRGADGAVLCAVVDQPLINNKIVRTICKAYETARTCGSVETKSEFEVLKEQITAGHKTAKLPADAQDAGPAKDRRSFPPEKLILCPLYGHSKQRGNPVLFGPYWRPRLAALTGDAGGRQILNNEGAPYIEYIDFEMNAGSDVDTPDEYKELYNTWGYE